MALYNQQGETETDFDILISLLVWAQIDSRKSDPNRDTSQSQAAYTYVM